MFVAVTCGGNNINEQADLFPVKRSEFGTFFYDQHSDHKGIDIIKGAVGNGDPIAETRGTNGLPFLQFPVQEIRINIF
ncbi:MAG: hypothetical protein U5N56_01875 [Candidatus Marinimicrobia bacterium]|nr:hypothetical protein [Candidatus Neomarinimicrobiota bacterium]